MGKETSNNKIERVVIKVGSAVVTGVKGSVRGKDCGERCDIFSKLATEISALMKAGTKCVLVSSGAIAMGMEKLGMKERPSTIPGRQAVAAVGQSRLMARYDEAFSKTGVNVAQLLITHDDMGDRKRFLNARNTLTELLGRGILPIINENDTVAVEEIKYGDNDKIAALVANLVGADRLVILSDIDGVFDKDPKVNRDAKRIEVISDIDAFELAEKSATTSAAGSGGISSKITAAKIAAHHGCETVITSGFDLDTLEQSATAAGSIAVSSVGTFVKVKEGYLSSKEHWIKYSTRPTGKVVIDDGAKNALLLNGKSLLPSGVVSVGGTFDSGDVIHCVDASGMEFARGVVNYSSVEIEKIKGLKTSEIEKALGYKVSDEVIHRDDMVVL
ncbi:MAG: glutamate 5-kinase [Deltaproteobacteria bacterium]|nr:glutamate 5-kinase [Deltaproteobacteria bacterium]